MKRYIDLHTHSTYSDGCLTPAELVNTASMRKIQVLALTDHDNIGGIDEAVAAGSRLGVEVISGVEISAEHQPGTMHILGYFIDHKSEHLGKVLHEIQAGRGARNQKIVEKLNELGISITLDEVLAEAGEDQIGRPHFAKVLIKKGAVKNFKEAFEKYLAKGKSAYVDRLRLSPHDSIELIHRSGGLAVLAHPKELRTGTYEETERIVGELTRQGLDGLEVYSSAHEPGDSREYLKMADSYDLFVTGGSDFHGMQGSSAQIGILGTRKLDDAVIHEMKSYLGVK